MKYGHVIGTLVYCLQVATKILSVLRSQIFLCQILHAQFDIGLFL